MKILILLWITSGIADTIPADTAVTDSFPLQPSPPYMFPQSFFKSFFDDPFPDLSAPFDSSHTHSFPHTFSNKLDFDVLDDKVIVTAYIPGSDNSKINVKVEYNTIKIDGEMTIEKVVKDNCGTVISSSSQISNFSNAQPIPVKVDPTIKNMHYENDTLTIELQRKKETP